jgi:RimJ/RimL family protein N-acetyltransferase
VDLRPFTLEGHRVQLVPLSMDHFSQLCQVGLEENLWRYSPTLVRSQEDMRRYIENSLRSQSDGTVLPFVTFEKSANMLVGSTRFLNIDAANRRVEIGATWVVSEWQKTYVNTDCKYLMLRHAFENLGCVRVEFKTDSVNEQSRKALVRIGAKEEGTLRNHMIMPDGRLRHSVYYSIIDSEWPEVKGNLEKRMGQR